MLVVFAACLIGILVLVRLSNDRVAFRYAGAALLAHVVFAFAQYWVQEVYYGISDVHAFTFFAQPLVQAMDREFWRFAPEVLKMGLHIDFNLPGVQEGGDSSTTMIALTSFLVYAIGPSTIAAFVVVSIIMWLGSVMLGRTFAYYVEPDERPLAYIAAMLVPSVVFWSSSIIKEGFVMLGIGILCMSLHQTLTLRRFHYALFAPVGIAFIATIKPYVLFPFVVAVGTWLFISRIRPSQRGSLRIRPLGMLVGMLVVIGGVLVMGQLFPQFAVDKIAETTAHQQEIWDVDNNGSNVMIGSGRSLVSASLASQLPYIPLALFNSLFRPVIFEARNVTMAAAAIETTVLTVIFIRTLVSFRIGKIREVVLASPIILASTTFVFIFSIAVGLTTLNLGSLSRYRLPMIPFYVLALTLVARRLKAKQEVAQPSVVVRAAHRDRPVRGSPALLGDRRSRE